MTDDLAAAMAHLRELGHTFGGGGMRVLAVDVDAAMAVCDACERQAQEIAQLHDYASLLERGFGSHEARESVWPAEHTKVDS